MFYKIFRRNRLTSKEPSAAIDEIISQYISPLLKKEGYKKSGRTWTKSLREYSFVINVQASRWNGKDTGANFVINYGIYLPNVYELILEMPKPKNPKEYDCMLRARVRLSGKGELWWEIFDHTDTAKLGKDVVAKLQEQCLSAFDTVQSIEDMVTLMKKNNFDRSTTPDHWLAVLYAESGDLREATKLFTESYKSSADHPEFQDGVKKIAAHYGIDAEQ